MPHIQEQGAPNALLCPKCGYNLSGLPQDRCPECGGPFDRRELIERTGSFWPQPARLLFHAPAILVLVPVWLVATESDFGRDLVPPRVQGLGAVTMFLAAILLTLVNAVRIGVIAREEASRTASRAGDLIVTVMFAAFCQAAIGVIGFLVSSMLLLSLGGRFPLR